METATLRGPARRGEASLGSYRRTEDGERSSPGGKFYGKDGLWLSGDRFNEFLMETATLRGPARRGEASSGSYRRTENGGRSSPGGKSNGKDGSCPGGDRFNEFLLETATLRGPARRGEASLGSYRRTEDGERRTEKGGRRKEKGERSKE